MGSNVVCVCYCLWHVCMCKKCVCVWVWMLFVCCCLWHVCMCEKYDLEISCVSCVSVCIVCWCVRESESGIKWVCECLRFSPLMQGVGPCWQPQIMCVADRNTEHEQTCTECEQIGTSSVAKEGWCECEWAMWVWVWVWVGDVSP